MGNCRTGRGKKVVHVLKERILFTPSLRFILVQKRKQEKLFFQSHFWTSYKPKNTPVNFSF